MKIYPDKSPCKGCNERTAECHGNCEKYRQWLNDGVAVTNNNWFSGAKDKMYHNSVRRRKKKK